MTLGKVLVHVSPFTLVPLMGQIPYDPTNTVERLSVGGAQAVLAIVCVFEAIFLYKLFSTGVKERDSREEKLQSLIVAATDAHRSMSDKMDRVVLAVDKCHEKH